MNLSYAHLLRIRIKVALTFIGRVVDSFVHLRAFFYLGLVPPGLAPWGLCLVGNKPPSLASGSAHRPFNFSREGGTRDWVGWSGANFSENEMGSVSS